MSRSARPLPGGHPRPQQAAAQLRRLADADRQAEGYNPLCGDQVTVYVRVDGDRVEDVSFEGRLRDLEGLGVADDARARKGKSRGEIERFFTRFHDLVTGHGRRRSGAASGKLAVLAGVREFPARVKCATLAWHTLRAALDGSAASSARSGRVRLERGPPRR